MKTNQYMSYESYALINSLIDAEIWKLENSFRQACYFCPSSTGEAHKTFIVDYRKLKTSKDELHKAAQSTYKNHPSQKMKEFWGLTNYKNKYGKPKS